MFRPFYLVIIRWYLNDVLHKFLQTVCVSACLSPTVARHRLGNHVFVATNTCNNRKTVRHVVLYTVRVVSKESLWVRVFSVLVLCTVDAVVWRLSEPSYSKIWSWVSWDWELRTIVLVRASSNILNWTVYPLIVARQRHDIQELLETSFSMRSVSYQRKVGDQFLRELIVTYCI
jgi:hypothetical protein